MGQGRLRTRDNAKDEGDGFGQRSAAVNEWDIGGSPVVIGRAGEGRLAFGPLKITDDPLVISGYEASMMRVPVVFKAAGLSASSYFELEEWGGCVLGLIDFFADMALSWRGWVGAKAWQDDSAGIEFIATHDGKGTVRLCVSMASQSSIGSGTWKLDAFIAVDPGSLDATTAALRRLLLDASRT